MDSKWSEREQRNLQLFLIRLVRFNDRGVIIALFVWQIPKLLNESPIDVNPLYHGTVCLDRQRKSAVNINTVQSFSPAAPYNECIQRIKSCTVWNVFDSILSKVSSDAFYTFPLSVWNFNSIAGGRIASAFEYISMRYKRIKFLIIISGSDNFFFSALT